MIESQTFEFLDPGELVDGDLHLVLEETRPPDPERGYAPEYRFKMMRSGYQERIGDISLRVGDTEMITLYAGHIGYGVEPRHRGHHYAARAVRLLLPLARRHGIETLWITCNPDNLASRRTCELAGAEFVEVVDVPEDSGIYQRGEHQKCRYKLELSV